MISKAYSNNKKKNLLAKRDLDKQKKTSRAYKLFKSAIKTTPTLKAYNFGLDSFMIYSGFAKYDQVVKRKPEIIQEKAENFILELIDQEKKSVTIRQYLAGIELFFQMNKMLYHPKVLKNMIPSNDYKKAGYRPYTNEEIKLLLDTTTKLRTKAVIHFFASTGATPYDCRPYVFHHHQ